MKYLHKMSQEPSILAVKENKLLMFLIKMSLAILVIFLFFYLLKKIVFYHLNKKNDSPYIIKDNKNSKNSLVISQNPNDENSITLYRSDNQEKGIQFTYVFWMVIENMEYKFNEWKHVFHKGNKTGYPNRAPGVFIHPKKNSLRFYMNTYKDILEHVDIDYIVI